MFSSNKKFSDAPFQEHEVDEYERKRYRGIDQRIVDWRERRILRKILQKMRDSSFLALDIPCGYGRFSGMLLERGYSLVSSDLSFFMVRRAREKMGSPGGFSSFEPTYRLLSGAHSPKGEIGSVSFIISHCSAVRAKKSYHYRA